MRGVFLKPNLWKLKLLLTNYPPSLQMYFVQTKAPLFPLLGCVHPFCVRFERLLTETWCMLGSVHIIMLPRLHDSPLLPLTRISPLLAVCSLSPLPDFLLVFCVSPSSSSQPGSHSDSASPVLYLTAPSSGLLVTLHLTQRAGFSFWILIMLRWRRSQMFQWRSLAGVY